MKSEFNTEITRVLKKVKNYIIRRNFTSLNPH